jgi:hypothetical protein
VRRTTRRAGPPRWPLASCAARAGAPRPARGPRTDPRPHDQHRQVEAGHREAVEPVAVEQFLVLGPGRGRGVGEEPVLRARDEVDVGARDRGRGTDAVPQRRRVAAARVDERRRGGPQLVRRLTQQARRPEQGPGGPRTETGWGEDEVGRTGTVFPTALPRAGCGGRARGGTPVRSRSGCHPSGCVPATMRASPDGRTPAASGGRPPAPRRPRGRARRSAARLEPRGTSPRLAHAERARRSRRCFDARSPSLRAGRRCSVGTAPRARFAGGRFGR